MAAENLYASASELAKRVPSLIASETGELDPAKADDAEALLEAISRAIDSKTRRQPGAFSPAAEEPSERVIYGNGKTCLEIPEHVAGTVNETVTTISGISAPKFVEHRQTLCITDSRGVMTRRESWREGVPYTITARWGYAQTPGDIREACLIWAMQRARMNSGDVSGVVTTITRDGATLMRDDVPPVVNDLIKPYIQPESADEDDRSGIVEFSSLRDSDSNPWS